MALVRSFGMASATPMFTSWTVPLLLDHTDIASILHNKSALRGHLCDRTAFLYSIVSVKDESSGWLPIYPGSGQLYVTINALMLLVVSWEGHTIHRKHIPLIPKDSILEKVEEETEVYRLTWVYLEKWQLNRGSYRR